MMKKNALVAEPITEVTVRSRIYTIRGVQVMLDRDVAELYGVPTKALNQTVKRNLERFPDRFMFQLTKDEFENLRSQIVTSSWGGVRKTLVHIGASLNYFGKKCFACSTFDPIDIPEMLAKLKI